MKYLLIPLLLTLFACSERAIEPGETPAEEFVGTEFDLARWQGQWLVINYWAKWCAPCIKEIPELNALDQQFDQVTVVGVNFDGATGHALKEQVEALNIQFPTLSADPALQIGATRPQVLPTTFVLNPLGKRMHTLVGPQTLESLMEATGQAGPESPQHRQEPGQQ